MRNVQFNARESGKDGIKIVFIAFMGALLLGGGVLLFASDAYAVTACNSTPCSTIGCHSGACTPTHFNCYCCWTIGSTPFEAACDAGSGAPVSCGVSFCGYSSSCDCDEVGGGGSPPPPPTGDVDLKVATNSTSWADSISGIAPLNDVDVRADFTDANPGENYTVRFDCTDNGTWEHTFSDVFGSVFSYIVSDLCDYSAAGAYTAEVEYEHMSGTHTDTATIVVGASTGNLLGRIVKDDNGDGVRGPALEQLIKDPSGPPNCADEFILGGASLSYSGPANGTILVNLCNPDPYYQKNLPVGEYTLTVNAPAGWTVVGANPISFALSGGDNHKWFFIQPPPSQCSDAVDNDGDGFVDFPADPDCTGSSDEDESGCAPRPGGNHIITGNCTFAGSVSGVDNGNLTIAPGATLTIADGQTIVWNPGKTITVFGAIVYIGTGKLVQTNLWMIDADNDGWPADLTQIAQDAAPANGRRRFQMTSIAGTPGD